MSFLRGLSITGAALAAIALSGCNLAPSNSLTSEIESTEVAPDSELAAADRKEVEYMATLSLLKNHLRTAKAFLEDGKFAEAESYLSTTLKPLSARFQTQLQERDIPAFNASIDRLIVLIKNNSLDPQVVNEYEAIDTGLELAMKALSVTERESPEFMLKVMNQLLEICIQNYQKSVSPDNPIKAIEYQQARAALLSAVELYQQIPPKARQENPKSAEIEANLAKLKTVFPSLNPPESPVLAPKQVTQVAKTIQTDTQVGGGTK
jgi:hypothetical protein